MKTVVTSILLANLNIRDLLNILLKGSFSAVTELICMITGIQFPLEACSSPTTVQVSHLPTHSCPISRKRKRVFNESKEVTITMEMKTPNAGGIASIILTRTHVHVHYGVSQVVTQDLDTYIPLKILVMQVWKHSLSHNMPHFIVSSLAWGLVIAFVSHATKTSWGTETIEHCCLCYANDQRLVEQLESDKASTNPIISHRSKLMDRMLTILKTDGLVFTKDIVLEFRQILNELNVNTDSQSWLCNSLCKYINTHEITTHVLHQSLGKQYMTANNSQPTP